MNQREAKRRALMLCAHILKEAIDSGKFTDMVDDDTTDDEAERITLEADEIRFRLQERAERLEAIEHQMQPTAGTRRKKSKFEKWLASVKEVRIHSGG